MTTPRPSKTLADHLVMSISPLLVMLLVGSLCFFLIEVFFRGEAINSVRWVMFWFVLAVVLVSRIGIEQGESYAMGYGLLLALATWFYLMKIHPAFILGMLVLGIVWWCANKLTRDCTLIDEDEDASGGGLLENAGDTRASLQNKFGRTGSLESSNDAPGCLPLPAKRGEGLRVRGPIIRLFALLQTRLGKTPPPVIKLVKGKRREVRAVPHSPGLWVVYFSLAALPIFGLGQMMIAGDDALARRAGFIYLFIYLVAALGLLLTTSFLGLRRYLRQRYLEMPDAIAFGWVRFGVGVAVLVLVGALLLPRPGADEAWVTLRYHIDHQLRAASDFAMKLSPHGTGEGRPGNEPQPEAKKPGDAAHPQEGKEKSPTPGESGTVHSQESPAAQPVAGSEHFYQLFRMLLLLAVALLAGWWLFRKRELLRQMARAFWAAVVKFFRDLLGVFSYQKRQSEPLKILKVNRPLFESYHNPFLTGGDAWTHEKLVLYSFEALQAWAEEKGIQPRPEQTAREFCEEVGARFPEINTELYGLSFLYGHAAYGMSEPRKYDLAPVKSLWNFFYRSAG